MQFNFGARLKAFWENSKHVMNISYKPSIPEFSRTAKVIILGILVIGVLGYVISIIINLLGGTTI